MTIYFQKLKEELEKIGIKIEEIYDLVNSPKSYPEAIPILVRFLSKNFIDDRLKEGIIRALAVKEAKGKCGKVLIKEFNKTPKEKSLLRWAIGNTMEVVISKNDIDDVIKIIKDKTNGISRQMFIKALGKIKTDKTENILIDLLDDEEVAIFAVEALGKMKSQKAKNKINELLNSKNKLVKKEAEKALKRIE